MTDLNEDMLPLDVHLPSLSTMAALSRSCSPPPSPRVQHKHTAPPPPPQIQPERTIPPSSPRSRHMHATPSSQRATPSSQHATPASQCATPSLPRPEANRDSLRHATPSSQCATPSLPRPEVNRDSLGCATPSSQPAMPLLPHPEANRESLGHATPSSQPAMPSLPPPPKQTRLPPAPLRQGYTPGQKPRAADYENSVEKMLLDAMHEYACLILTNDTFPNGVKQTHWAKAAWLAACDDNGVHYECLITSWGSWAHGFLKDAAQTNFRIFKFKKGSSDEIKHYNQE
ncbi:hypothetical protein F5888DRAFT_1634925 [Russula emetica]|nr:hypothetical protein F5888DRAFT_1634925 [Russula emetica]